MASNNGLTRLNTNVYYNPNPSNLIDAAKFIANELTGNSSKNTAYETDLYSDKYGNLYLLNQDNDLVRIDKSKLSTNIKNSITNNKKVSLSMSDIKDALTDNVISYTDYANSVGSSGGAHGSGGGRHDNVETTETEPTKQPTSGGGGVGSTPTGISSGNRLTESDIRRMIEDVMKPKVMSADEIAELYDFDYNLDNIRANYDAKTQKYYDDLIAQQDIYRTLYDAENARFDRKLYNAYADSYRNAAQTRAGQAIRSANLLSSMINSDQYNAENDYGMLQSINNLKAAQEREFAENPYTAEKAYNTIGTYASQLSAKLNESQVQQYRDKLLALADMYNSERQYQADVASGIAAKYSGLAGAAKWNSQNSANSTNNINDQMYKFYNQYLNGLGYTPDYAKKQGYTDVRRNYDTTSYINK